MSAFSSVNYSLRPGKNVVRKLVFEVLGKLAGQFDFTTYTYVGFGSIWFVDFILAHKLLGIANLISIEEKERTYKRALFNSPFACVKVERGSSSHVLPDLSIEEDPHLFWLDYTETISDRVLEDCRIICEGAQKGSILVLTINAHVGSLTTGYEADPEETIKALKELFQSSVPPNLDKTALDTEGYPPLLAKILLTYLRSRTRKASGDDLSFIPLFNLHYQDNAPMLAIGGILASEREERRFQLSEVMEIRHSGEQQYDVGVPELTPKEKRAIDQLLPDSDLTQQKIMDAYDFDLKETEVEAYKDLYQYYPLFYEIMD